MIRKDNAGWMHLASEFDSASCLFTQNYRQGYFFQVLMLLTTLIVACGQTSPPASSSASQAAKTTPSAPEKIRLNGNDIGTTADTSALTKKLKEIFQLRKENGAYMPGMESRVDLTEEERIEKTVFIKPDREVRLGEIVKVAAAVDETGASPILFPIESTPRKPEAKTKLRSPAYLPGSEKPNPLLLMVSIGGAKEPALGGKVITGGITIVPSGKMLGPDGSTAIEKSFAVVNRAKGERASEDKQLPSDVQNLLKAVAQNERALFVKAPADLEYGALENIVYAAGAAGAEVIYLITGEQEVRWDGQDLFLTLPAGWRKYDLLGRDPETLRWKGPAEVSLTIDISNAGEIDSPEVELQREYERRSKLKDSSEEIRYAEVDGLKGLLTRSVDNERGVVIWQTFRPYQGKLQYVSISLSSPAKTFKQREAELYGILYSTRFIKR